MSYRETVTPGNVPQDLGLSERLRRAADEYDRICFEASHLIDDDYGWLERWDSAVDGLEELLLELTEAEEDDEEETAEETEPAAQ